MQLENERLVSIRLATPLLRKTRRCVAYIALFSGMILAGVMASPAAARTIQFAGMTWTVKAGYGGPGPNRWSDSSDSVWVDAEGRLHLKIRQIGSLWYCSEVLTQEHFGHARYTMKISSNAELYDPNAVVGFFTYKNDLEEIDIELTKWGNASDPTTGQFAVQPSVPNTTSRVRFVTGLAGINPASTYSFTWGPDSIFYQAYHGHADELQSPADLMQEHTYVGSKIPPLSDANLRINFWMFQGRTPTGEMELIVDDVLVTPFDQCDTDADCSDGVFCNGAEVCVDDAYCVAGAPACSGPRQSCSEAEGACVCNWDATRLEDYDWFGPCLNGPATGVSAECLCADRNEDGVIDLLDFAIYQAAAQPADLLFDFESGDQGWFSFGNGTLASGVTASGSIGQGRYHVANFDDGSMTWGVGDKSADGVDLSAYSGMSIDLRLTDYDTDHPFVGTPVIEFMLSIGSMEWARELTLTDAYQTFAVEFADLAPQAGASQPVTQAQLSDPGMRIKLVMRKNSNSGRAMIEYDQVSGLP